MPQETLVRFRVTEEGSRKINSGCFKALFRSSWQLVEVDKIESEWDGTGEVFLRVRPVPFSEWLDDLPVAPFDPSLLANLASS